MSRRALGERVQVSDSAVAAWEVGRNIPDPKTLRSVERTLGTDGLLQDIVEHMVAGEKPQEFIGKWAYVEAQTTLLLRFSFEVFPGLLQTEDYARAILRDDDQVKARMERQKVLSKEDPPVLVALIDESVLHRHVGSPSIMRDQLHYLEEMSQRAQIVIQVIKMSSPIGAQYTGPFTLASRDGDTAIGQVDDALSGDVVESVEEVSRLRRMFEMLRKHALSEEESIRLIKGAAEEWPKKI